MVNVVNNETNTLTISEFFGLIRCIRMLYGLEQATYIFEQNLEEFTGVSIDVFKETLKKAQNV